MTDARERGLAARILGDGMIDAYTYRFEPVVACNMCGGEKARVLGRRLNTHQGIRARKALGVATTIVRCCGCGLIYANPRPIPATLEQHYGRAPESYWRSCYFEQDTADFDEQAATFRRLWRGRGTPSALDVGAGLGKAMAGLARNGFDTYGLEPSPAFHARAIATGIDSRRLRLASIEDAEYEPETFDLVSFGAVLEHLHDPAAALARAREWTSPGGLIHAEVPSAKWLMAGLLNLAYRLQGLDYVTNLSPMHPPYHLYEFTLESFRRHARRASYELAESRFYAGETFLPPAGQRIMGSLMTATGTGMQLEVWLRR